MTDRSLRSLLFVPASRIDRVPKAQASGAHAVIVDLEDAVAPSDKAAARQSAGTLARNSVLVRINGADTPWFDDDLRLCAAIGVKGVILPKTEDAGQIVDVVRHVGADTPVYPLIETARGFDRLDAVCRAPNVRRLVFGSVDLQLDLGITGERDELLYFRSRLVLASRIASIGSPLDGVTLDIDDPARVRDDALYGKRLGFGGKLCIHPKQVASVNQAYAPSDDEVAWARRVLEVAGNADAAAVAVDGRLIDRPVILKAEAILAETQQRNQLRL